MGRRLSAPGRQQAPGPPAAGVLQPTLFHAFRPLCPGAGQVSESSCRLPFFATGLIAAKPQKPCDGGVFGVFYLLLKKERNEAGRAADGLLSPKPGALLDGQSAQPTATKAPRKARPCPGFCCCPHPTVCAGFATGLIAAKPVKPCDGGVFGAFYLLLKKERLATGAAGAAAKSFLQAARWRPCETRHGQRAAFCHERRLP